MEELELRAKDRVDKFEWKCNAKQIPPDQDAQIQISGTAPNVAGKVALNFELLFKPGNGA